MSNQQSNLNAHQAHLRPTLSSQNPYSVPVPPYGVPYTPSSQYYTPTLSSTVTPGTPMQIVIPAWRRILHLPVAILRMFFRPSLAIFKQEIRWAHWGMIWLLLISVMVIPAILQVIALLFFPVRDYSYDVAGFSMGIYVFGFIMELALFFFYTLIQYISSGDMQTVTTVTGSVEKGKRFGVLCYSIICIALPLGLILTFLAVSRTSFLFPDDYYERFIWMRWIGLAVSAVFGLYSLFLNIQAIRAIYGFGWLRATIVTLTPLMSAFILVGGYLIVWQLMRNIR